MLYNLANTYDIGLMCRVFLDGNEVKDASSCHTREGWVKCVRRKPNGDIMHYMGSIMTLNSFGTVTVDLAPL